MLSFDHNTPPQGTLQAAGNRYKYLQKPGWVLLLMALLTLGFALLNLRVPSGGILDNALLDEQNPYAQAAAEVARIDGLAPGDTLGVVVPLPDGLTVGKVQQIAKMSEQLKRLIPSASVLSITHNSLYFQSDSGNIQSRPYLSAQSDEAAITAAVPQLQADALINGPLLDLSADRAYAQILLFLPKDYSEHLLVDQVAEYLEQRRINELEWLLLKGDIEPTGEFVGVSLSGWSVARGLMHYALISDVLFYSTIGLLLAMVAAYFALGSHLQALYVSLTIFASFIWVRGSIGLLDWAGVNIFGVPLQERVYFLLVLSAMIVSGISLNVRAFESFNDAAKLQPNLPASRLWQSLRPLAPRFNLVIGIAVINFLSLGQIGIRGILEVGLLSALGLLIQRLLVVTLLPALQLCFGGRPQKATTTLLSSCQQRLQRQLRYWPQQIVLFWQKKSPRQASVMVMSFVAVLLIAAIGVIAHDVVSQQRWIKVQEKPIDYLPDTIIDRGRQLLNAPKAYGFAQLSYVVRPKEPAESSVFAPVEDPQFLAQAAKLQQQIANLSQSRGVTSILDKLPQLQDGAASLPQTAQQAHDQLQLIRWDLADERLANFFWYDGGLVLMASHPADDSVSLRAYAQAIEQLAATEFPDLQLLPFGRLHSYHQTDLYISERKPVNVLWTMPLVLLFAALWFWRCNQKLQRAKRRLQPLQAAAAICLPFVLAYSVVVIVMAVFAIPLDQATACATALGINAAIDFDLYLVEDFREALNRGDSADQALQYAIGERGHLTLLDAGLNAICFSLLLASTFIPMQRLGGIMLLLLATCAFGALFLLAGVLRSCVHNHCAAENAAITKHHDDKPLGEKS